jgi:Cys-tRNA synthase (O-phospho-L-seryl-tRNA:Cys-tRNA synthase)
MVKEQDGDTKGKVAVKTRAKEMRLMTRNVFKVGQMVVSKTAFCCDYLLHFAHATRSLSGPCFV